MIGVTNDMVAEAVRAYVQAGKRGVTSLMDAMRAALEATPPAPVDMLLFCPECGTQHIDEPEPAKFMPAALRDELVVGSRIRGELNPQRWTNPPHRSHLCHACKTIWRPADVPTNGVAAIATRGKADTWTHGGAA